MPREVGRPTNLTNDLLLEIKKLIIDGKTLREIAEITQVSEKTLYGWHASNYQNLNTLVEGWKRERMLRKAEVNLEEMLDMPVETLEWEGSGDDRTQVVLTNPALVRIKQDTAKFVAETLGKKSYSKQTATKSLVVNVSVDSTEEMERMAELLNNSKRDEIHSRTNQPSNGIEANALDRQVQAKE